MTQPGRALGAKGVSDLFAVIAKRQCLNNHGETSMQTRPKIAFEAMADRPEIRAAIEEQIGKLEQRLGPVRACGVTVKGASPHRSGQFELTIRLAAAEAPEIKIGPPLQIDPRYTDLTFAISDTFRRATRRLRDQARARQNTAKKANRPTEAVGKRAPSELRSPVSDSAQAPIEPAAVMHPPLSSVRSEPTTEFGDANGSEQSADANGQPISASIRPELLGSPEPPATAEHADPTLVEAAGSEAKPTATLDDEPSTLEAGRYASAADAPTFESEPSTLAEPATDEQKQPAVAENATMEPLASKVVPEVTRLDPPSIITRAAANECAKANPHHPTSPLRMPPMTPLSFLAAMGDFVRTAAALNRASTNLMNSYFACSVGIFNPMHPMRTGKPSPADTAFKR